MSVCLTNNQTDQIIRKLVLSGRWVFTKPFHFRLYETLERPTGKRLAFQSKVDELVNEICKTLHVPDVSLVFTDITIEKRASDKHSISFAFSYDAEESSYILEVFDPNGELVEKYETDQKILQLMDLITDTLRARLESDNCGGNPRDKLIVSQINKRNLNTVGTGHCASWTLYYIYHRPGLSHKETKKLVSGWRNKEIFGINRFLIDFTKKGVKRKA